MIAQVGDRIVVLTAPHHTDGTPPYEVRRLDDGHVEHAVDRS